MSIAIFDERIPIAGGVEILPADTTSPKTVVTAPGGGARVDDILITNSDAIAHVVSWHLWDGAITWNLGSISIPAGSGVGGIAAVQPLATQIPAQHQGYIIPGGTSLRAYVSVAMQAGTVLRFVYQGGQF